MNELTEKLRTELSDGRFRHSLGVAQCARELAVRFGCDTDKAYLAGLLHDCATKYSGEEMLDLALKAGLRKPCETSDNPVADYHAPLGAYVAKHDYGVTDSEILQAIAYHQLGNVPMTKLDMIISLADGIEPSRKSERIDAVRKTAETDLLEAYIAKCALYMSNILAAGKPLPPKRVEVYNYLLTLKKAD